MWERIWQKGNPDVLLVSMYDNVENSLEVFQKAKQKMTMWAGNYTFKPIQKNIFKKQNLDAHKLMLIAA